MRIGSGERREHFAECEHSKPHGWSADCEQHDRSWSRWKRDGDGGTIDLHFWEWEPAERIVQHGN